ncbi:hypothetical protein KKG29_05160 [Patescibacteria group bacterium]|nr:hypothetical protein [Patescibacteria group bacterium]
MKKNNIRHGFHGLTRCCLVPKESRHPRGITQLQFHGAGLDSSGIPSLQRRTGPLEREGEA